jgi:hypothetical protein
MILDTYLNEIQKHKNPKLIIKKDDLNAPLFKWRTQLAKDLYGKFCKKSPCKLITYSFIDESKEKRWKKDTTCVGGMAIIEDPSTDQTQGYKVNVMIIFLFIEDDYRGLKLGSKLVKDVIKKYKKVFLTTDKRSSDVAKDMYKKYGFKMIHTSGTKSDWIYGV